MHFLVGGTQVNLIVAAGALKPWQGVISAETGHVNVHEAGAIEATGHKVLVVESKDGLLSADAIDRYCQSYRDDPTAEHMVQPGMIYLSQTTELGTVYHLKELRAIRQVADRWGLTLFVDGARLASALAIEETEIDLPALAELADVFSIGGTKCGALFGEAVVIIKDSLKSDFRSLVKQRAHCLHEATTRAKGSHSVGSEAAETSGNAASRALAGPARRTRSAISTSPFT